jgi:hypothetical protein
MICLIFIEKLGSQRPAISGKEEDISDRAAYECGKSSQTPDSVKYDDKTNVTGDGKLRIFQLKSRTFTMRITPTTLSIILHL